MGRGSKKLPKIGSGVPKRQPKKPHAVNIPEDGKQPAALNIDHSDAWRRHPVWRFELFDDDHPQEASALTAQQYSDVYEALGQYEKQSCSEIWSQQDNGCKRYEIESAHQNITKRLTDLDREDETAVHTLRVAGRYRIYGILRENVFHVLWLDPGHQMWPSRKRNT